MALWFNEEDNAQWLLIAAVPAPASKAAAVTSENVNLLAINK